ncbi:hypothetical protein EYF80_034559 [Liparis tanakae]|uniref:Uncharacterized protein n=1 Tax=Liparis tanakae TaxID=230148 RepID=A0A4Z2GNW4_9TELE|nr:hypothetical protein EYF80_034559 [Liparis tanakae]
MTYQPFAALSSPVGSKLLHLSPGLTPPEPPPPGVPPVPSAPACSSTGGAPEPLPQPKSHDMLLRTHNDNNNNLRAPS